MDENDNNGNGRALEIIVFCACLLLMCIIGVGLFQVRQVFPYVGYGFLGVLCVLVLVGLAIALEYTIRRFTRHTYHDVGPQGTIARGLVGTQQFAPQAAAIVKVQEEKTAAPELSIPTVAELLKDGTLGTADLLLGFRLDGSPMWGSWDAIRTFCIAGKGRSGKTVTMFFIALQVIMNGGRLYLCDPHYRKKSSITALLKPLGSHIRFAGTDEQIADLTNEFIDAMEARVQGQSEDLTPLLYVVDEFTRIVNGEDGERVFDTVVACAQQYAGFNGFAMIAGHEWTGRGQQLAKLRRALHAKYVHRLDPEYAKYLLNSSKWSKAAPTLKTGWNFLQDSEGDIHELRTPLGISDDALTVAALLQAQLEGPYTPPALPAMPSVEELTTRRPQEQIAAFYGDERETFRDTGKQLSLQAPQAEKKDFVSPEEKLREIQRLRQLNFNQSQIIQHIWHIKPGGSAQYQQALAEYKQLLDELVRSA